MGAWFAPEGADPSDRSQWVPVGAVCTRADCDEPATTLLIAGGRQFYLCTQCAQRQVVLQQIRHAGQHRLN